MRAQRKGYWCGIASIANALEVLGIRRTQREIAKLCDAETCHGEDEGSGADETEMKRALLANGVAVDEYTSGGGDPPPWTWLYRHVSEHGPVILCVDNDEHWVTVIGVCADRAVVFDPSRNSGIEVLESKALYARWVNEDGVYYGIGVSKS